MGAKVSETARLRPGKCAITNDTEGPFIDTGTDIPRYGRVYLSIRGLRDTLRSEGFLVPEETAALREDNDLLQDEVRRLTDVEDAYHSIVDAVRDHIEVEPEVRTETKVQVREPNDDEIESWIQKKGADHPAIKRARGYEKGSTDEWRELYGDIPPGHPQFSKSPTSTKDATLAQELASQNAGHTVQVDKTGTFIVEVKEQDVDLFKVLDQNVGDVLAWAEGHEEDVQDSLVQAEYQQSRNQGRSPRKGVVEGLGYEYVSLDDYFADAPVGPEVIRDDNVTPITEETEQDPAENVQVSEPDVVDDEGVLVLDDEDEDGEEE